MPDCNNSMQLWALVLAPLPALGVYILGLWLTAQAIGGTARMRRHFGCCAAGALCLVSVWAGLQLLGVVRSREQLFGWMVFGALTYANLCFCFFNFYSAQAGALRVVLLKVFLRQDPEPVTSAELFQYHSASKVLSTRIEQLERSGQMECVDGRYILRKRSLIWIGRLFAMLTYLILGRAPK